MSISLRKVRALLKKDLRDTLKSPQFLVTGLMPLLFALLYTNLKFGDSDLPPQMVLTLCTLMNTALNTIAVMAMMIAEEKEKNTLRTLMLSNVSAGDFLVSKTIVAFSFTEAINVLVFALCAQSGVAFGLFLPATAAASVSLLILGAIIGLLCKNQMATGVLSAPAALALMLPVIFADMNQTFAAIARFTPTGAMIALMRGDAALTPLMVWLVWVALAALIFAGIFQKKRLD